jgi:G:T-mismatch repair DNA endonuclease (very short patch repair protein)
MHDLHQDTVKKATYLKEHGFNVMEVWECQIKRELERDEEMKGHTLYGGRTNAARLYHHCEGYEKIRYAIMLE